MIDWCDDVCDLVPGSAAFHGNAIQSRSAQMLLPDGLCLEEIHFFDDTDDLDDEDDDCDETWSIEEEDDYDDDEDFDDEFDDDLADE